ncbi:MAG: hypothetical protein IJ272_11020, partial [Clostridia bacterium]|nr:hypothetical protein [Clostridia bacterium]
MSYFDTKRKYLMNNQKTNEYIKDGLQLWLDGIENTRNGHTDNKLYVWEDLSGNKYDFGIKYGAIISPAGYYMPFNSNVFGCANVNLMELLSEVKERTIEIVCTISDSDTTAKTILMGAKSGGASYVVGMWYRPASGGMCTASTTTKA